MSMTTHACHVFSDDCPTCRQLVQEQSPLPRYAVRTREFEEDSWAFIDRYGAYQTHPIASSRAEAQAIYDECEDYAQLVHITADAVHIIQEK